MVSPPDLETPFRRAARRLTTPAAGRFDEAEWRLAYDEQAATSDDDTGLLNAALWTGREIRELVARLPDRFPGLSAAQAVMLGVAAVNVEYRASERAVSAERAGLQAEELVSFDYMSHLRYANDHGQRMSQSDFGEAGIEALASWLYDARRIAPIEETQPSIDEIGAMVRAGLTFYSMRAVLKNQFDKALHQGARLLTEDAHRWEPHDWSLACLKQAWQARAEADLQTAAINVRSEWPELTPGERRLRGPRRRVTGARLTRNGARLVLTRPSYISSRPPYAVIEKRCLQDSWLATFLTEQMPLSPGISIELLASAWQILADATRALVRAAAAAPDAQMASACAAALPRKELARVFIAALQVTQGQADDLIRFLTFSESAPRPRRSGENVASDVDRRDKGNRGLWEAPLVEVPGETVLLLPQPVFEMGSLMYRVEGWLEKGGIDDDALDHRGDRFERYCRSQCAEAIRRNPNLAGARIAPDGVERSDGFPHQVDLLFKLGGRLFVGEIKCFLTPADPHQWDRFFRVKLAAAADQARVRAAAFAERPDVAASALGLGKAVVAALEIVPIIILNTGTGFSLEVDGCRVVNADFLLSYLRSPTMESGAAMHFGRPAVTRLVTLYDSEQSASANFDAAMAAPWTLQRFLDRMERDAVDYPRPTGGSFSIASPFRGNLTEQEAALYAHAINAASGGRDED